MATINREKITTAIERMCEMFEEQHLTMEERAIVSYASYVTEKRFGTLEEFEQRTAVEEKPQKISKVQIVTAVCSVLAIIISLIAMLFE